MEGIIKKELKEDIFSDEYEYFFCFLSDRFEYAAKLWAEELEKKFEKKFKPIWVISSEQSEHFKKENFIILNKKLKDLKKDSTQNHLICLQDYEDLNKEFSESDYIEKLIEKLIEKQNRIFILGFTSASLKISNPKVIILGADPKISDIFDNKVEHIKLFEKLEVHGNKTRTYETIEEIKKNEKYPYFVSASYSSGGHESKIVYTEKDLEIFYGGLRDINKNDKILVSNLISDIFSSPNINAMIAGKNDTRMICITDQILRGNAYLGNIYPSKIEQKSETEIIRITKIIGDYLSNLGFRGLFGLDFIINSKKEVFPIDLNPRRQGGYLCNVLMSKKINIPEMELKIALGEEIPPFEHKDFEIDYAWAHSKIKPYFNNTKILNDFKIGEVVNPFSTIGSEFSCIFYPKDSLLIEGTGGYMILTGNSHEEVRRRILKGTEKSISINFELYEGLL
jgi:predicted ATP-grasp superfamily ATP-dependent carboligase